MQQQHIKRKRTNETFAKNPNESIVRSSAGAILSMLASGTLRSNILRVAEELVWGLKPTMPYSMSKTVK